MQKKIIALAVAALASSAAFAQTNVTVYGIVDAGQAFVKSSTATDGSAGQSTVGRLDNNSSYIGFKGVEDLGNGLKALFVYETNFAVDNGGALAGGRDSYVGLTGGFGTVVAGNLTHPLRAFGAKVELTPGAAGFGTMSSVTGKIGSYQTGADNRAANAVAYVSPSFGGFSGTVAYINGEKQANAAGQAETRAYQVAAQYENGPLFVGAGYHAAKNGQWAAGLASSDPLAPLNGNAQADARVYRLAAVYTLPTATKLTALYDNTKVETGANAYSKRSAWSVGAAQSFGKNTVGVEYGQSGNIKDQAGTEGQTGTKIVTALYTYELSKRTTIHARASKLWNKAAADGNFYLNPVSNGVTVADGSDVTGYMLGLRHAF